MPKETLSSPQGERSWTDEDKFLAVLVNVHTEKINGDDARILTFGTDKGEVVERWSTAAWERLLKSKTLKPGDVLEIEAGKEKNMKGGKRFRPFAIARLTGKDIPKNLR